MWYSQICLGVFDGHGKNTGAVIAKFVRDSLPRTLLKKEFSELEIASSCSWMQGKIEKEKYDEGKEGETPAVMGLVKGNKLFVANVGDSRAIGILSGKTTELSCDHKPSNTQERDRINRILLGRIHYGRYVLDRNRNGLAMTRSFGDLPFHEDRIVIPKPEVKEFTVAKGDKLIFATDGLWDVMNNEEVVQFLSEHTVDELVKKARKRKSRDDITAVVAVIK